MAGMSDFLENEILDHVLSDLAYTAPTSLFIGLYTAAPSDSGGGTEATGGSYARLEVGAATGRDFTVASGGASTSNEEWAFVTCTADWGTIINATLMDALTVGNQMFNGALAASKVVDNGDTFKFLIGDFDVTLD